ncbi:MAG TPA: DUF2336 domain-containing protein [Devosiaceae bacterium]|jgi:uncharacterized protein (DUF2336 family)|nr:DUF2336 domain-containing protein [Devosiaceae bacterium]
MVAYQDFVALCRSGNSEDRGQAAHLAAMAYLGHNGPAEEHAALYAALIGFLDDPSVKVRAALAYGLLHARDAPRPVLLALLQDSLVISRAVAQYSPALIDADLIPLVQGADPVLLAAVAERERLSARLAAAIVARGQRPLIIKLLARPDVPFAPSLLASLADDHGATDATMRGLLLRRPTLPAAARLSLVEAAAAALERCRVVRGAVQPKRLTRLLRDSTDTAMAEIGERQPEAGRAPYAAALVARNRLSARVMLHAVVNGHVLFFADCLSELSEVPRDKVFTLLETGSRSALNALLLRCGLAIPVCSMMARLIFHARAADLADDLSARHFVVTALTEELIVEHEGDIPVELEEVFQYLSEQNIALARRAARGVMSAFATEAEVPMAVPLGWDEEALALPAA